MASVRKLFLLLTLIGPLHMGEQLLTGLEEFHAIRGALAKYYAWFDPAAADRATVILITVVWTACSLMLYSLLQDGAVRLVVPGLLGFFAVTELHHVVEALAKAGYDPGLVTCVPYAVFGALLVRAAWRELPRRRSATASAPRPSSSEASPAGRSLA